MNAYRLLLALLATSTWSHGASFFEGDHVFGQSEFQYEYFLSQTVFGGYPNSAAPLVFYAMPSFRPEYGVWMSVDKDGYTVVHSRAKKNLWSWAGENWGKLSELEGKIRTANKEKLYEFHERTLAKGLGNKVVSVWQQLLLDGKTGEHLPGIDGNTGVFRTFIPDKGRISRDAWSPAIGTPAAKLWAIGDALGVFARTGDQSAIEKALALKSSDP